MWKNKKRHFRSPVNGTRRVRVIECGSICCRDPFSFIFFFSFILFFFSIFSSDNFFRFSQDIKKGLLTSAENQKVELLKEIEQTKNAAVIVDIMKSIYTLKKVSVCLLCFS